MARLARRVQVENDYGEILHYERHTGGGLVSPHARVPESVPVGSGLHRTYRRARRAAASPAGVRATWLGETGWLSRARALASGAVRAEPDGPSVSPQSLVTGA